MLTKGFLLRCVSLLIITWLPPAVIYASLPQESEKLLKFSSFYFLYLPIFAPLLFFSHLCSRKQAGASLAFFCVTGFACAGILEIMSIINKISFQAGAYGLLLVSYLGGYFLLAMCLKRCSFSCASAGLIASILAFLNTSSLFWMSPLLKIFPHAQQWLLSLTLHSNPLLGVSLCLDHYDYLRSGLVYQFSDLGKNYTFSYPSLSTVCVIYWLAFTLFALISFIRDSSCTLEQRKIQ